MPFPALTEAEGKLKERQDALAEIFRQAGPDMDMSKVTAVAGDTKAKVEEIRKINGEIDAQAVEVEQLRAVDTIAQKAREAEGKAQGESGTENGRQGVQDGSRGRDEAAPQDLGSLFVKSRAYTGRVSGGAGAVGHIDADVKVLMTTTAGWPPETTRTGTVIPFATRPIQVIDVIPSTTTGQAAVVYMEETTYTNAAVEVSEGGTYPEAALGLTEKSVTVRKIAVWLPMTDEQLEDEPQARGYINNRLPFMVRQRLDGQLINGDGIAPNILGLLQTPSILSQAKGADPVPDAVYKAMTQVRLTGRAIGNTVVMHPTDWQNLRLLRTADGIYIWGSPSDSAPERLWGLPVAQSDAIAAGTGLVFDSSYVELAIRRGIETQVTNSHGTYFVEGKQAVRADMRCCLVAYRPTSICKVTGM